MKTGKINRKRESAAVGNAQKRSWYEAGWGEFRNTQPVNYKRVKAAQAAAEFELGHAIRLTRASDFNDDSE
jgi:hypothetical protein